MTARTWISTALLATEVFMAMAAGCGGHEKSCVELCTKAEDENCPVSDDCRGFCSALKTLAEKSRCIDEYDQAHWCAQQVDVCRINIECAKENKDFLTCAASYCLSHSEDQACGFMKGFGE